jgi:hypothetical protein
VRAGAIAGYLNPLAEAGVNCLEQCLAACCVPAAKVTQMALIHSGGYKLRESLLLERGGVLVVKPLGGGERRSERFGYDEVTHAESGIGRARKGPQIDDAPFGVETLQRLERAALLVKLAVVVVLDDHGVFAPCPFEERKAPGERKNRAGGKLMRWRYEDQTGLFWELCGIQAVVIDWHRQQPSSGCAKHLCCALLLRILDGHAVTAFDEYARDKIQRLLGATNDDHFRWIA